MILVSLFKREKLLVFVRALDDASLKTEAKVKVDIQVIRRDAFPEISDKFKNSNINMKETFGTADICVIAEINGILTHWGWVTFNEAYLMEIEKRVRVDSKSAYLYGVYTIPDYRRLGIYSKVMEKLCNYLQKRGFEKVYLCIVYDNIPSLRAAYKAGYQKIGSISFTKIYRLKLYVCKSDTKKDYNTLMRMFFF